MDISAGQARPQRELALPPVATVGKRRQDIQSPREVRNAFEVRRPFDRALARSLPIVDRPLGQTGLRIVVGHEFGLRSGRQRESFDEGVGNARVKLLPPAHEHRLVRGLLDQRVLEEVRGIGRHTALMEQV